MTSSRQTTLAFRNAVVLSLQAAGLRAAATPTGGFDVNAPIVGNSGQVVGVAGWSLVVRAPVTIDLSGSVRAAEALALQDGNRYFATVLQHRGRPIEDAYCVMPLRILSAVITELRSQSLTIAGGSEPVQSQGGGSE